MRCPHYSDLACTDDVELVTAGSNDVGVHASVALALELGMNECLQLRTLVFGADSQNHHGGTSDCYGKTTRQNVSVTGITRAAYRSLADCCGVSTACLGGAPLGGALSASAGCVLGGSPAVVHRRLESVGVKPTKPDRRRGRTGRKLDDATISPVNW